MNPSRLFIERPVATSLLMVAILLAGLRRLPAAAAVRAARGRLPDDPGHDALSGREPGRHRLLGDRAARAPVRPDAGPRADVVDEFRRRLGDHAALRARAAARRRRAGGAGRDQRRLEPAAERPADAADLQQGQSGRRADPDPRRHLAVAAGDQGARPGRYPPGAEDLAGPGRRSGRDRGRAAARRAHPGEPDARSPRSACRSTTCARAIADANVNQAKGSFDGAAQRLDHRRQRPADDRRRIRGRSSSPTRTARRSA